MTWLLNGAVFEEPSENDYGFVYKITNNIDSKIYIGKKLFWFMVHE